MDMIFTLLMYVFVYSLRQMLEVHVARIVTRRWLDELE
jgi:hypothetical protein